MFVSILLIFFSIDLDIRPGPVNIRPRRRFLNVWSRKLPTGIFVSVRWTFIYGRLPRHSRRNIRASILRGNPEDHRYFAGASLVDDVGEPRPPAQG